MLQKSEKIQMGLICTQLINHCHLNWYVKDSIYTEIITFESESVYYY